MVCAVNQALAVAEVVLVLRLKVDLAAVRTESATLSPGHIVPGHTAATAACHFALNSCSLTTLSRFSSSRKKTASDCASVAPNLARTPRICSRVMPAPSLLGSHTSSHLIARSFFVAAALAALDGAAATDDAAAASAAPATLEMTGVPVAGVASVTLRNDCTFWRPWSTSFPGLASIVRPITFAGTPTAVALGGIAFSTTDDAPILAPSPTSMLPSTVVCAPMRQSHPTFGCLSPETLPEAPKVTPCSSVQLSPRMAVAPITMPVP
mmetsp:Transcript_5462/g.18813  ORF Transcript_5462/g.18813 Transcript_5462/m.18813 type:complete len:266 (+) Transcript_5462:2913-3710(+)